MAVAPSKGHEGCLLAAGARPADLNGCARYTTVQLHYSTWLCYDLAGGPRIYDLPFPIYHYHNQGMYGIIPTYHTLQGWSSSRDKRILQVPCNVIFRHANAVRDLACENRNANLIMPMDLPCLR